MASYPDAPFTAKEYADMLLCYGEAMGNATEALKLYVEKYPNRRHPSDPRVVEDMYQRVIENKPIVPQQEDAGKSSRRKK
ncbi:hypothetical protein NE865_06464 [Phthorimaea operculella]|nr:hypothetical protein NE865_06464 [Phthorimaea operculella]